MAVSQEFAPPFKLIAPYFILGVIAFVISVLSLFGFNIINLTYQDISVLSWAHLFLLGFVMMVIFGAMAQLIPVVLEVGHFAVELYYVIYPLLFAGMVMMVAGFKFVPALLPYGGSVVLIALLIFIFETFMTIRKVKKFNLVITSVAIANGFLLLGLIFGILMALGFAGVISIDFTSLLRAHVFLVLVGYVGITIMGMSMILLPMFWLSHSYSDKNVTYALWFISIGVIIEVISSIINSQILEYTGYFLTIVALGLYFCQMYVIYKTRVRADKDIYLKSMIFAYVSLIVALVTLTLAIFLHTTSLILAVGWIAFFGYIGFMITGHLYKIVPFLVWYERFSPLVGKEKVPMLADMLPKKSANLQFIFSASGIAVGYFGLLLRDNTIFHIGVYALSIGSIFVLKDLLYMIRFK